MLSAGGNYSYIYINVYTLCSNMLMSSCSVEPTLVFEHL